MKQASVSPMRLMRNAFFCCVAGFPFTFANAGAADVAIRAPSVMSPVSIYNWTGLYVGAHLGGIHGSFKSNVPIGIAGPLDNAGSVIGGLQIGYNWQFAGPWVIGIEWDVSGIDVSAASGALAFQETWMSTLRGRLGYAWDRYLLYFTAGSAWTHVKTATAVGISDRGVSGLAIGGGLEGALPWPNWTLRGEFLYVNVPLETYVIGATRIDGGSENYIGRFGVNYRF
jgi:outer membrane immunogenic protein